MKKEKVIKKLYEIMHQYELSIVDGIGYGYDPDAKEALKDNEEIVEALKFAIEALKNN